MFLVDDIFDEAKKIIGVCSDAKLFRWLGDSVSLVANKADLEGWKGFLDVCTAGCACDGSTPCTSQFCGRRTISLPREVDTVIAVNIGGKPALGRSMLFNFHLNGPGDCRQSCEWTWNDGGGFHSTFRDITVPTKLVAYLATAEDNNKKLIVYGYDSEGKVLRRQEGGVWVNGYRVPTVYGAAIPDVDAPTVARISGVFKEATVGNVRLSSIDDSGATGVLLGVYEPDETTPQYRRITLNRSCNWARIAYLKTNPTFSSVWDHVPLRSRLACLLALQARKHYGALQYDLAHSCEADAARIELEAQTKAEPPVFHPLQVVDMNSLRDNSDYPIS
jgi:hypothetical protein